MGLRAPGYELLVEGSAMRQKRIVIVVAVSLAALALTATGCSTANNAGYGTNNRSGMMNGGVPNTSSGGRMMNRGGSTNTTTAP